MKNTTALSSSQSKLVQDHLKLVEWVIYDYIHTNEHIQGLGYDDLYQTGCLALIGRFNKVKMINDDGIETTLQLSKNCKLRIGDRYRLYFKSTGKINIGNIANEYISSAMATDSFLGFEHIES